MRKELNFSDKIKFFKEDAKRFYREIGKKQNEIIQVPSLEEIENFWTKIWSNEKDFNQKCGMDKGTGNTERVYSNTGVGRY